MPAFCNGVASQLSPPATKVLQPASLQSSTLTALFDDLDDSARPRLDKTGRSFTEVSLRNYYLLATMTGDTGFSIFTIRTTRTSSADRRKSN
jgi:hypothetical protein